MYKAEKRQRIVFFLHITGNRNSCNKRIVISNFDVIVCIIFAHFSSLRLSILYKMLFFCVCFSIGNYLVSGIMHTSRRRLGMERERHVSKLNKRQQYCARSGIYPNMLRYSYVYNRVHRLCWCTS